MRRVLLIALVAALALAAVYQLVLRDTEVTGEVVGSRPVATIGSGSEAVGVAADGTILRWLSLSDEVVLPQLPLSTPPDRERLAGTLLAQARVLGAAPEPLRPHLAGSHYGESGVNVELRAGGELRFGDASRLGKKWRAAATVLADPALTTFDYVNLHAPRRPATYGSGHELPPIP